MIITVDHYDYIDQKVVHSVKITFDPPRTFQDNDDCTVMANLKSIFDKDQDILVPEIFNDPSSTQNPPNVG